MVIIIILYLSLLKCRERMIIIAELWYFVLQKLYGEGDADSRE